MSPLRVEPEERRTALAGFVTLGLVMCAHSILETARDTLFLRSLPPTQLPWVYLIIAALTLGITVLESRVATGVRRRDLLAYFLILASTVTTGLWASAEFVSRSSIWVLYVWTGVFGTLATIHFWLSIDGALTVTQAKRLFGFVGAGALTGAIVGSALARVFVSLTATANLVLVAAIAMMLAGLVAHSGLRRALRKIAGSADDKAAAVRPVRVRESFAALTREGYARRIVLFVLVSTVALTLTDYLFKQQVARSVPSEELGSFFASFYATLNVFALVVQLGLVGWLLDRVGVHRALCLLPALLVAGGFWAGLGGGLSAVILLKGSDGSLRHSLHRTASEVLFVPLSRRERDRTKTVSDVVGHRGGQAVASLLILGGLWLADDASWLTWGVALLALVAAIVALRSRAPYLDMFRRRLGSDLRREPGLPPLDRHALEVLFAALDSPREREVIAALDVLREQGRIDLVPALILHHPSSRVVRRALSSFVESGRRDFVATALRIDTDDHELRAALLLAITAVQPDEAVLREALSEPSRRVRATAIVELTALGSMPVAEANKRLRGSMSHPGARRAIAAALALRPCDGLADLLRELGHDEDGLVRAEATRAMGNWKDRRFWPELLTGLREHDLRPLARQGFVSAGEDGLRFLSEALRDERLPHEVRLHVPRSISLFPSELATPVLWSRFAIEDDSAVRYKILRALGSLARASGGLSLDQEEVGRAIAARIAQCHVLLGWHRSLARAIDAEPRRDTARGEVLRDLLEEELAHELEQAFRTLTLRYPGEDFRSIHRGLSSHDPVVRASCEELLSEVVDHDDRRALLELARIEPGRILDEVGSAFDVGSIEASLGAMIERASDAIAAIAAAYAAELGEFDLTAQTASRQAKMASSELSLVLARAHFEIKNREALHG